MTKSEFIEIIVRCQSGDKNAIGKIYEEYFGRMCATAFKVVNNADAAYDIASNVILKLLEFRQDVYKIDNPIGYIIRMIHNEAYDYLGKRRREVSMDKICDCRSNVLDMLWLEDILVALTEKERTLFILHIVWDIPLKKAAKCCGITYGTAKLRYKNIKSKIEAIYKS